MLTKYFNMNNINNYISCYFSLSKLLLEKKKKKKLLFRSQTNKNKQVNTEYMYFGEMN